MRRSWVGLVLVLLTSCGGGIELTGEDEGTTVEATVGDTITLVLDSNLTTGYAWHLTEDLDQEVVRSVSSDYETTDDTDGGGGEETWVFEAVGPGTTDVAFTYYFENEPDEPTEDFRFTVIVGEDA